MLTLVDIREASLSYERWLAERVPLVRRDLELKHRLMSRLLWMMGCETANIPSAVSSDWRKCRKAMRC